MDKALEVVEIKALTLSSKPAELISEIEGLSLMERVRRVNEILPALEKIRSAFDESDGEITTELEASYDLMCEMMDHLSALQSSMPRKIDKVLIFANRMVPAMIEALDDSYKARRSMMQKRLDELELYIEECAKANGGELEGEEWKVKLVKNPGTVVIDDDTVIPDMFKRAKVSVGITFDAANADMRKNAGDLLASIEREYPGAKCDLKTECDKKAIGALLKDDTDLDGAHMEYSHRLKYSEGRAKLPTKTAKRKAVKDV